MVDLAAEVVDIPSGLDEEEWQFYQKASNVISKETGNLMGDVGPSSDGKRKDKDTNGMNAEPEEIDARANATPAAKPRATFAPHLATPSTAASPSIASPLTEGITNILLNNLRDSSKSAVDTLVDTVETHSVPESDRLSLLQKIRILKSLSTPSDRRNLLVVRILAIAIFSLTTTDANAQSKLFLYEPELISQLAELVHPDREVSMAIQAASLYALEAISKSKSKTTEVASALNASVSHGILMSVLRRTIVDLQGDNRTLSETLEGNQRY
jgi:E3 ubiquitin-protein ligase HUWE1